MISFNKDSAWDLKPIPVSDVRDEVNGLLIDGEEIAAAFSKVQFFSVQTPGFAEIIPDSELVLTFSNGYVAKFEFKGGTDIGKIGRMISDYVLK